MLIGRVRRSQLFSEISRPIFRESFESRGASIAIPIKARARSKMAYSKMRNCLRVSMVVIFVQART